MPPPLIGFWFGVVSNFGGSKSGLKQSVKLLQNVVSNTTQHHPTTPSQPHTVCIYCTFTLEGVEGGGGELERKLEGQQFTKLVENTIMTDCISSL
jgi:hypothetical protein